VFFFSFVYFFSFFFAIKKKRNRHTKTIIKPSPEFVIRLAQTNSSLSQRERVRKRD